MVEETAQQHLIPEPVDGGTQGKLEPGKENIEIRWAIAWDGIQDDPDAIAHIYAYPGGYLEIGQILKGSWYEQG